MGERCLQFLDELTDRALAGLLKVTLLCSVLLCTETARVYQAAAGGSRRSDRDLPVLSAGTGEDGSGIRLVIDDTGIDFPVMQGSDNTEYLTKDPDGNYSVCGSVFLDCRNSADLSDPYNLVYGHHMRGQYMFGALD
ncbi:MAG: class B sortase, partial [Solobacterium sp.]|nr:class B sortase [Solobacterium sp.]